MLIKQNLSECLTVFILASYLLNLIHNSLLCTYRNFVISHLEQLFLHQLTVDIRCVITILIYKIKCFIVAFLHSGKLSLKLNLHIAGLMDLGLAVIILIIVMMVIMVEFLMKLMGIDQVTSEQFEKPHISPIREPRY